MRFTRRHVDESQRQSSDTPFSISEIESFLRAAINRNLNIHFDQRLLEIFRAFLAETEHSLDPSILELALPNSPNDPVLR